MDERTHEGSPVNVAGSRPLSGGSLSRDAAGNGTTAFRASQRLMGEVAHDLRSPLNGIVMAADLIEHHAKAGRYDRIHTLLEAVRSEAHRMDRLIDDLLDAGRLAEGVFHLEVAPVAPAVLVERVCQAFGAAADAANTELLVAVEDGAALIEVDANRILQVLSNLIDNAIRYTPSGGRVVVSTERRTSAIRFMVRDMGPGIDAADRERIFRPYARGARPRGTGAGLGLSIAKRIVASHGGRMGVESEPGAGSTFWFELPHIAYGHE